MSAGANLTLAARLAAGATAAEIEVLAQALLRAVFVRPDLNPQTRDQFIADMVAGKEELTLGFADFVEMARVTLAGRALDVEAERAAWQAWYFDPDGYGGKTFGYQDTREGHHSAFAAKSERAWLERAAQNQRISSTAPTTTPAVAAQLGAPGTPEVQKFPAEAYAAIDPAYELMDNGRLRSRATGEVRPHYYSGLPIPFKVGDRAKVVDGNWQFPLGKIARITHIDGDVVYFDGVACCWERLDPYSDAEEQAALQKLEAQRYQWVRQPSNLNCMMFEFKGNTPAQVDAYIDKQTGKVTPTLA